MMEAIAYARGLAGAARAENTYLIRDTADGKKRYRVDLTRVAAGKDPDVVVRPNDRIIVGTSWPRRFADGLLHILGLRSLAPVPG